MSRMRPSTDASGITDHLEDFDPHKIDSLLDDASKLADLLHAFPATSRTAQMSHLKNISRS